MGDERPESQNFDPRFDLPKGETQRLLAMAERGEQPSNPRERGRKLDALVWLTWVDPKYTKLLKRLPHYSEQVTVVVNTEEWEAKENLTEALFELDMLFQVNQEMRQHFEGVLKSDKVFIHELGQVDKMTGDKESTNRLWTVLRMTRLWPEKKTELQDHLYPPESRNRDVMRDLESHTDNWSRLATSASAVLLFPELRTQILEKIKDLLLQWKSIIARAQQTETPVTGFEVLQTELSSLAILFAENAYINDQGLVKLELAPLPAGKSVPLPDRPLA